MTQSQLFEENIEWAKAIMWKARKRRGWPRALASEIENAALTGLWKATKKYQPALAPGGFRSYAYGHIYGAMVDQLRQSGDELSFRNWKDKTVVILHWNEGLELHDARPENGDAALDLETEDFCACIIDAIPDARLRRALYMYFKWGFTMKEIAVELAVCEGRVTQILREGIVAARRALRNRSVFRLCTEALEPQLKMGDFVCAKPTPLRALTIGDCVQIRLRGHTNSHLAKVQMAPLEGDLWVFVNSGHQERVYAAEIAEISRIERVAQESRGCLKR
jgi:RNA polymerase sigma factor (sigma-70 family)